MANYEMSVLMRLSAKGGVRHFELFDGMQKHAESFATGNLLAVNSWGRSGHAAPSKCRSASEESHRKRFSLSYERNEDRLLRAERTRSGSSRALDPKADAA